MISHGSTTGWEIFNYPQGDLILINVPGATDQLVRTKQLSSWTLLNNIYNARCWALFAEKAIYGGFERVGKAFNPDTENPTVNVASSFRCAYSNFGLPGIDKLLSMGKPTITNLNDLSSGDVGNTYLGSRVDYNETSDEDFIYTLSTYESVGYVSEWVGLQGFGKDISIEMLLFQTTLTYRVNSIQVMFEAANEFL